MATRRYYSATAVDNTVSSSINSTANAVVLTNSPVGYPGTFPYVVALDYNNAAEELVLVTNASGNTLNITRGYNGSSQTSHNAGAVVRHVIIAQDLTDFQDHIAAGPGGVHGITGSIGTFLGTPTSANLASAISDETGSGPIVFATGPTLSGPTLTSPVMSTIVNTGTLTLPTTTGTVALTSDITVTPTSTNTLTNKTLTAPIITQGTSTPTFTTNAYTLVAADAGLFLLASNSSTAGTINIPTDATYAFPNGTQIHIQQTGTGQLTIQAATSGTTTVVSNAATAAAPKIRAQYSVCTLQKNSTNNWTIYGDIA